MERAGERLGIMKYNEYKGLNLSQLAKDVLADWEKNKTFEKSIAIREGKTPFVFYEGPPSANGLPGIHHVMGRAIKDIFCRYKAQKGFLVNRRAGWDTHGLPIELGVEKSLGITKEDIGNTNSKKYISVEDYNKACRKEVMKYTDKWEEVTKQMGYWVDMENPYITYDNKYIESVWWLLQNLFNKGLIYKGFTIQPFSPAAGTGLSSHELNQPGCYRDVKDRTAVAMFKAVQSSKFESLKLEGDIYFLAWTTTPWTLPSNTALAVGKDIEYVFVKTINPHSHKVTYVILAKNLFANHFVNANDENWIDEISTIYSSIDTNKSEEIINALYQQYGLDKPKKPLGFIISEVKGSDLAGLAYEQLLPFAQPTDGDAFKVILDDFVTTEDGTGIVHIAPSFGADDFRVAKQNGIGSLTLVDKTGRFLPEVQDGVFLFGHEFVKEAYLSETEKQTEFAKQKQILESTGKIKELKAYLSVDERIVLKLQEEGKLFKKEQYVHSYPHCWRTDKPILYYPLDSWFIKTTAVKDRMIELNKTINWKPEATGTGRFGNWLENLNDWNLSRSRFWGIPIPIWTSYNTGYRVVVGSKKDLIFCNAKNEITGAVKTAKAYYNNPLTNKREEVTDTFLETFDFHKPFIDNIVFVVKGENDVDGQYGIELNREPDLIDVWFDSGAMPFAQMHFPFENVKEFSQNYPADFIAEGVDQTRGWFFTLHAISVLLKEEIQAELQKHGIEASDKKYPGVAFKNVISNGLVLDKNGNKMSKRLGNATDPFETLEKYGADATRWYMITNAAPWDNLKFDVDGITEVQRKFFGTLYNTYSFFALYANVDKFIFSEKEIPLTERPEIDQWIISELNTLIKNVDEAFNDYEPHRAGRYIETFVDEHLSNWYVRLCRRRFWKGEYSTDKIAAYQTLYICLDVIAQLSAPIAPFFADRLFCDLNTITKRNKAESVHLSDFPVANQSAINKDLETRMELAQKVSSMVLSIRKKENLRVRQPLQRIQIPVLDEQIKTNIEAVKDLILAEVNVKEIEFVDESQTSITKNLKLNFKTLGKKCGKHMKALQAFAAANQNQIIAEIEKNARFEVTIESETIELVTEDVEIIPVDILGWKVANIGALTVALDINLSESLIEEGIAREIVNRIQNIRKDKQFDLTDKIIVKIKAHEKINSAIKNNLSYICAEILATSLEIVDEIIGNSATSIEIDDSINTKIEVTKLN